MTADEIEAPATATRRFDRAICCTADEIRAMQAGATTIRRPADVPADWRRAAALADEFGGMAVVVDKTIRMACWCDVTAGPMDFYGLIRALYGVPGDRLGIKEAYYADLREPLGSPNPAIIYAATPEWAKEKMRDGLTPCSAANEKPITRDEAIANLKNHRFQRLRSPAAMPAWAVRYIPTIVAVSVERVADRFEWVIEHERITP